MLGRNVRVRLTRCTLISVVVAVYVIFYLLTQVQPPTPPKTTTPSPLINTCTRNLPAPPRPYHRLPTLVIYVHSQHSPKKDQNFLYFLRHGLCEHCKDIDFYIVINGESSVSVIRRENSCGDFGAWAHVLDIIGPARSKAYKRFMFLNDSVRGPFIDPKFKLFFPEDFHFVDIYASHLTNETRIVGSYISCETHVHVQSMAFMLDEVALSFSRPRIRCYANRTETIDEGEIGITKNLMQNYNINPGCLLYAYQGIDFRCNGPFKKCNDGKNPHGEYFGSITPYEVVFFKTYYDDEDAAGLYASWLEQDNMT
jgi:hypothetical protein